MKSVKINVINVMKILGIESSCDDTSVALIEANGNGFKILAEKTASQIEIHKKYGGVVPEIAGRMHAEKILPLIEEVLKKTPTTPPRSAGHPSSGRRGQNKPDVIAVTSGPGLITGLLVGVEAARALSYLWDIPIVSVNHIEGHIHSPLIPSRSEESLFCGSNNADKNSNIKRSKKGSLTPSGIRDFEHPALALIASGGHTELIYIKRRGRYKKIGATLDDAAGECFDKVAKLLGFDYPGGPKISQNAETGNPAAIKFPRPMLNKDNFNFSFAGLKTSALYWLRDNTQRQATSCKLQATSLKDFCASFEQAIIDVLVGKTLKAALQHRPKTVILGGGVAANKKLRETLEKEIKIHIPHSSFRIPQLKYAMDNAAMIAVAGYYKAKDKKFTPWKKLKADPNWEI